MEGCIPNLLGRGEGQQIKKVNDDKDLHCSAHQIKGTVVGGIIEMPSRRQAVMKPSGCRCGSASGHGNDVRSATSGR